LTTAATGATLHVPVHVIHVRSSATGLWSVEPEDREVPRSQHLTETEAERTALRRADTLDECSVVIHDRYSRVRIVPVSRRRR
jgi:hypothetical protein